MRPPDSQEIGQSHLRLKLLSCLKGGSGDEIRTTFGIEPTALTREEAQYLIDFRTADELRNRATAAKQARVERLRSKGTRSEEVSRFSP